MITEQDILSLIYNEDNNHCKLLNLRADLPLPIKIRNYSASKKPSRYNAHTERKVMAMKYVI